MPLEQRHAALDGVAGVQRDPAERVPDGDVRGGDRGDAGVHGNIGPEAVAVGVLAGDRGAHPAGDAAYFAAFYLLGTTYAPQALWYSWMADLTAHDVQLRAITTGFMNSFDFAFVSWWPLVFYPVTDAPDYRRGYVASLVTGSLTIPLVLLIAYLEKRGRARGTIGRVGVIEEEPRSVPEVGGEGASANKNDTMSSTRLVA